MAVIIQSEQPALPARQPDELNRIALHCAELPLISQLTDDEILGYDELGIPTR